MPTPPSKRRVVWYGQMARPSSLRLKGLLLSGVGLVWLAVFLVLPSLVLVALAFAQRGPQGQVVWQWTTESFTRLAGWGVFGEWEADNLRILARTVLIATVTTILCVALAYPMAFFIASRSPRVRYLLLLLVIVPSCVNIVIRTYAWQLIFSPKLPVAPVLNRGFDAVEWLAALVGWDVGDIVAYPGAFAVYVGMVTAMLPFAVLPIYSNVERMDWSIVDAARDLYASKWGVIRSAIVPQTTPGLAVAVILTFVPAMGMFVVPDLLSGAKYMLVGNLIQMQFGTSRDWPYGAAISMVLVALTLLGLMVIRRRRGGVELV